MLERGLLQKNQVLTSEVQKTELDLGYLIWRLKIILCNQAFGNLLLLLLPAKKGKGGKEGRGARTWHSMFWPSFDGVKFFFFKERVRNWNRCKKRKTKKKTKDDKERQEKQHEEDQVIKELKESMTSYENLLESSSRYGAYVEKLAACQALSSATDTLGASTPTLERQDAQRFEEQVADTQIDTPSVSGKKGPEKEEQKKIDEIPGTPISQQPTLVLGETTPAEERVKAYLFFLQKLVEMWNWK